MKSDTPETFVAIHNGIGRTVVFREDYDKLERQRDEARRDLETTAAQLGDYIKALAERDEAVALLRKFIKAHAMGKNVELADVETDARSLLSKYPKP